MEIKIKYKGAKERQQKIAENEALGLRMLHDTFDDPNWKKGTPIVGNKLDLEAVGITVATVPTSTPV